MRRYNLPLSDDVNTKILLYISKMLLAHAPPESKNEILTLAVLINAPPEKMNDLSNIYELQQTTNE